MAVRAGQHLASHACQQDGTPSSAALLTSHDLPRPAGPGDIDWKSLVLVTASEQVRASARIESSQLRAPAQAACSSPAHDRRGCLCGGSACAGLGSFLPCLAHPASPCTSAAPEKAGTHTGGLQVGCDDHLPSMSSLSLDRSPSQPAPLQPPMPSPRGASPCPPRLCPRQAHSCACRVACCQRNKPLRVYAMPEWGSGSRWHGAWRGKHPTRVAVGSGLLAAAAHRVELHAGPHLNQTSQVSSAAGLGPATSTLALLSTHHTEYI